MLLDRFDRGGTFHGVFDAEALIGVGVLESARVGRASGQTQLAYPYVSAYRGCGVGMQPFRWCSDGTAKLWDAAIGRELLTLFGHDRIVHTVKISDDDRLLSTASADGTVALHLLRIRELRRLARQRVTRTLTDEECQQYLHVDECPG